MPTLTWDVEGQRFYEGGVSNGVLYVHSGTATGYEQGVAWSGLTAVNSTPSGGESNAHYADNMKYVSIESAELYGATIEAFMYPDEFLACEGVASPVPGVSVGQQGRSSFGFSWQTRVGNDLQGFDHAYKIHVVWGAKAAPSEKASATINETPEPATFSWEVTTTPVTLDGFKPTSYLSFDSRTLSAAQMTAIKDALYGDATEEASLPTPGELLTLAGYVPTP